MAFFREQLTQGAAQRKRAEQLAAELKDPLRSEIKALLAQQRRIEAIRKFQAASAVA